MNTTFTVNKTITRMLRALKSPINPALADGKVPNVGRRHIYKNPNCHSGRHGYSYRYVVCVVTKAMTSYSNSICISNRWGPCSLLPSNIRAIVEARGSSEMVLLKREEVGLLGQWRPPNFTKPHWSSGFWFFRLFFLPYCCRYSSIRLHLKKFVWARCFQI